MITCTQAHEVQAGKTLVQPVGRSRAGITPTVIGFVNQISDVIFALSKSRPSPSEGRDWLAFDAAIRGLHEAIVALEDVGMTNEETGSHPW
jgi:hypothetical protein